MDLSDFLDLEFGREGAGAVMEAAATAAERAGRLICDRRDRFAVLGLKLGEHR